VDREGFAATRTKPLNTMTREQRAERERLLARYGYETEEIQENADGEEEIVFREKGSTREKPLENMALLNASAVREKQLAQKMAHKARFDAEQKRNKENLEKQRQEKELKKKGTQKREKVRG
ncbi:hypothetical protein HDU91_003915, partial [Kappamyces sp. JEL0680]